MSDAAPAVDQVRRLCASEGFDLVSFAAAAVQAEARSAAIARLAEGRLEGMDWITDEWLVRATDPGRFLPGARTVILLALPYAPARPSSAASRPGHGRIAGYALGRDYHRVFETKLRRIAQRLRTEFFAEARPTVDYGPLLERPFARTAGMGWLGKSTMLLVPGIGPYVLLGAVATTLELPPSPPSKKSCGGCTRCIAACPTGALSHDGSALDARLCISYHTIENRGPIPVELRERMGAWIFGCDACLDSCPVGRGATASHPDFRPQREDEATPELAPLLGLNEDAFRERYRGRAVTRAKRDGFVRNVCLALGNVGTASDIGALSTTLHSDSSPLVRSHAAWALGRIGERLRVTPSLGGEIAHTLAQAITSDPDAETRREATGALERLKEYLNADHR